MHPTIWVWVALAILIVLVAIPRIRARRERRPRHPVVDDAAIERILRHGTLSSGDDEPLDEQEIARAEQEFWEQSWDDPEEYGR
jgi:hypothetical protein